MAVPKTGVTHRFSRRGSRRGPPSPALGQSDFERQIRAARLDVTGRRGSDSVVVGPVNAHIGVHEEFRPAARIRNLHRRDAVDRPSPGDLLIAGKVGVDTPVDVVVVKWECRAAGILPIQLNVAWYAGGGSLRGRRNRAHAV